MDNKENILIDLENSFGDWFNGKFETPSMTKSLYPYTQLFSPIRVNGVTIKNRIVMGPMGNISMCDETGRPNEKMLAYFTERARGGVGLITTGLIPVSYGIDPSIIEPGKLTYFPRIDRSRTVFAGWRDLAQGVHSHGANIFIQLTAGLGRVGNPQCLINALKLPVSASMNPNYYIPQIPCMRLSGRKLRKIIKRAGQASADAKACGIDGVYLHGHEGYLMEQLTNPAFNRRKFGHFANWQNFGLDMVRTIRARVGNKFPIMYRIDLSLALNATYGDKMNSVKSLKKFKHERLVEQTLEYMKNLVSAGVDMFDVDLGCYDNWWLPHPPASMPSGCFLDVAKIVKDYFADNHIVSNAGFEVPVVAVGKLGYPDLAEQALRDNKCDMIMLARPLLADPEWPNKAFSGDVYKIRPCIGCHEACIKEFVDGGHPQCAVNPRTAFEEIFSREIPVAKKSKKVAVIGGGPSGMVSAIVLSERGHSVDLYEKSGALGGMLIPAGKPKIKYEIDNYRKYLVERIDQLNATGKINVMLNTPVSAPNLANKYDAVVVACGTKQISLPIKGIENNNVHSVVDVLMDESILANAQNIVIIGGGDSGCELAYMLSYENNKHVQIVEQGEYLMRSSCTANRGHILHYLEKNGVVAHNLSAVSEILDNKVVINKNVSKTVPNPYNTWQPILPENINNPLAPKIKSEILSLEIPADAVIIACGFAPNNSVYNECVSNLVAKEIYNVGDSNRPGKVFTAVKSAYIKCLSI